MRVDIKRKLTSKKHMKIYLKKKRKRFKLWFLISAIAFFLTLFLVLYNIDYIDYTKQQFAENIFDTPYAHSFYKSSNPDIKDRPYYGDAKASINFVAFTDTSSEASKDFIAKIFPLLKKDYFDSGIIRFYHKPYISISDIEEKNGNFKASMMLECIKKIKKEEYYAAYIDMLLKNITDGRRITYNHKIPVASYNECMYSNEALKMLYKNALEIESLGIVGINQRFYIVVGGKDNIILDGVQPYGKFQQAIKQQEIKVGR